MYMYIAQEELYSCYIYTVYRAFLSACTSSYPSVQCSTVVVMQIPGNKRHLVMYMEISWTNKDDPETLRNFTSILH